ncbi:integrase arm-type DNA-binding domain-containing protein [Shewanella cyperi]|uniref:Integrase arm-type DNA-binding domain-containing protein n=1 Tax=Shewanella cyperi TaxID=2814292 RepID=A0A974XKC1_9GAMM|nr:integrase arm-type DNA-binding domain-containing protein [Shewanella cyperi]QSX28586.1 integrase arm-type DNA-binding domain-containing protein [Shewanella cyperi]
MAGLTVKAAQSAQPKDKDYKLSDEKGLYLLVTPKGRKYWRYKYRFLGREQKLALGVFPEVSLKEARDARDAARKLVAAGINPNEVKQQSKREAMIASGNSFEAVARDWLDVRSTDKSPDYRARVERYLEMDAFPAIGRKPISEISAPEVLAVLRRVEARGALETAKKLKTFISQIFRYGIASGVAERDPAADLRGALKTRPTGHRAAITNPAEVGRLLASIESFQGSNTVKLALQLSALFFCRPGELRHLEWIDINWDERVIEISAEKMKMREAHMIPLSDQALSILQELRCFNDHSRYVFPSARGPSRPMSDNAVRTALRTLGYDNQTMSPHGFRAMARTILDEVLGYRIEWIEQQLAHAVKDPTGRAYNRTKHLKQRAEMMQHWADYLDELKAQTLAGNVISANFARG